jgi:hypothetical protein
MKIVKRRMMKYFGDEEGNLSPRMEDPRMQSDLMKTIHAENGNFFLTKLPKPHYVNSKRMAKTEMKTRKEET